MSREEEKHPFFPLAKYYWSGSQLKEVGEDSERAHKRNAVAP